MPSYKNLLLFFVTVVLLVLAVEWLLRILWPEYDPGQRLQYQPATNALPALGKPGKAYRLAKNTGDYDVVVRFNQHGLRDSNDVARATSDDILVLGDSFAFGWGLKPPQRFSNLLDQRVSGSVFNMASPSASIKDYLKQLDYAYQLGAHPGRVIVTVCMENDLFDYDLYRQRSLTQHSRWSLKRWLLRHSALAISFTYLAHQNAWLYNQFVGRGWIRPNLAGISGEQVDYQALQQSIALLKMIDRQTPARILIVPSRGLWTGPNREKIKLIHDRFVDLLEQNNLDYLDPVAAFEANGSPLDYHFSQDGHWNVEGHRLVTDLIAPRLTQAYE